MLTRSQLQNTLKDFPEKFTLEELMEKALLIDKIERANQQSLNQETISEKQLNEEMEKWFR
jgi:hypothetical protein